MGESEFSRRAEARHSNRLRRGALAPLAALIAIMFAESDAALEDLARHSRGHFIHRDAALFGAACVERAAANVDLIDVTADIGRCRRAWNVTEVTVGLLAHLSRRARLRNDGVRRLCARRYRQRGRKQECTQ